MDLGLKNKVIVVTGGSSGIGFATAKAFLQEGAKVAFCAIGNDIPQVTETLSQWGEVYGEEVDVSVSENIYGFAQRVYEKFGAIHCWVNNVGTTGYKNGEEYVDAEIDFMTNLCFKAVIHGSQAAFRYMKETGGSIINVSSLAARCATTGTSTLYGPLKAAIRQLTNTFAGEYCAHNIRVTAIMPGFTATPLIRAKFAPEYLAENADATLLGRVAEPEEIAKPIVFLASDAASYMTATCIEVSGGRSTTLNPTYAREKYERS